MENKPLHVAFTADNNYLIHWIVALESLLQNSKDLYLNIHFIYDNIDEKKLLYVKKFFTCKFNVSINYYSINSTTMNDFKVSHHINKSTYFRLSLSSILPVHVKKVLFLDCDLVVENSLSDLFTQKFDENISIYAVNHLFTEEQKEHLCSFSLNKTSAYFNAGVMFIDLEKWRKDNISKTLINFAMNEKQNILWWDQDVLNVVFKNNWRELHPKYNLIWEVIDSDLKEAKEAQKRPTIVHFTRSVKPWHSNSWHPYKELYWKHRKNVSDLIKEIE